MSTIDKLNKLLETKNDIKNAIIAKGETISDSDTFASYAAKISNLSGEGGGLVRRNLVVSDNATTMDDSDVQNVTISADTTINVPSNVVNKGIDLNVKVNGASDVVVTLKQGSETVKVKLKAGSYNVFRIHLNGTDCIIEGVSTEDIELIEVSPEHPIST